jgi:hypothetical protein
VREHEQPDSGPGQGRSPGNEESSGRPLKRSPGLVTVIAALVVGLLAAGGGAGALAWSHIRKPSPAQISAAGQRAFALQWHWRNAGEIFPATVNYQSTMGIAETATRVGIAPAAPCGQAMDTRAARALAQAGCLTMLRATYADPSGTVLATVGIAVLPSDKAANTLVDALSVSDAGGLLPVSFPGTIASQFGLTARETDGVVQADGPYLLLYAAGYADGRKTRLQGIVEGGQGETATTDLPNGLANELTGRLTPPAHPCAVREVRC